MFKNILHFLQKLFTFGRAHTQPLGDSNYATASQPEEYHAGHIRYAADLIPHLTSDHEDLVTLYASLQDYVQQQQYDQISAGLESLKHKFNLHIMQENLHFYCYLEQSFRDDAAQLEIIKGYRKEMNAISAAVVRFIKKWQTQTIDQYNVAEFSQEYNTVGEVLAQRITQEESHLYTLYQPQ